MLKPPEPQRIAIQVFLYTGSAANQRATNPAAGTDEAEPAEDGADSGDTILPQDPADAGGGIRGVVVLGILGVIAGDEAGISQHNANSISSSPSVMTFLRPVSLKPSLRYNLSAR